MLNAIIIDDEEIACRTLSNLVREYCRNIQICAMAYNAEQAREIIPQCNPDLIFLDIELNHYSGNGFDLLSSLPDGRKHFEITFTSGHAHYALQAIKASCIDFLLKPVDIDELRAAVEKARGNIAHKTSISRQENLANQIHRISTGRNIDRIVLPCCRYMPTVFLREINYFRSEHNHTSFFIADGRKLMTHHPIGEFIDLLAERGFANIHHSLWVNLENIRDHILCAEKNNGGIVVFLNGDRQEVSRARKAAFIRERQNFIITQ